MWFLETNLHSTEEKGATRHEIWRVSKVCARATIDFSFRNCLTEKAVCVGDVMVWDPSVGEHFWPCTTNPLSQTPQTLETKNCDWQDGQSKQALNALSLWSQRDKSTVYWLSDFDIRAFLAQRASVEISTAQSADLSQGHNETITFIPSNGPV
jgi:hypothetical protein